MVWSLHVKLHYDFQFDSPEYTSQMHNGLFNINGLTSFIANGDLKAGSRFKDGKMPNCLDITILRARDLAPMDTYYDGTQTSDPCVMIKARHEHRLTSTVHQQVRRTSTAGRVGWWGGQWSTAS